MESKDLVGSIIKKIETSSDGIKITTNKGTIISGMGDCGSSRNPEPYYSLRILPAEYCKEWAFFDICGEPLPCEYHDKKRR